MIISEENIPFRPLDFYGMMPFCCPPIPLASQCYIFLSQPLNVILDTVFSLFPKAKPSSNSRDFSSAIHSLLSTSTPTAMVQDPGASGPGSCRSLPTGLPILSLPLQHVLHRTVITLKNTIWINLDKNTIWIKTLLKSLP